MSKDLERLREKLCRELAQSERDAVVHTEREARRLGEAPPALALRAISEHASALRSQFDEVCGSDQSVGLKIGRAVGSLFSALREVLFDRMIDSERSFRATLLGCRHGVDVARLLREVALREGNARLVDFCDAMLIDRLCMIEHAEQTLAWFADEPALALEAHPNVAHAE